MKRGLSSAELEFALAPPRPYPSGLGLDCSYYLVMQLSRMQGMTTALLVIDVQKSFSDDASRWSTRNNPAFESNMTRLTTPQNAA